MLLPHNPSAISSLRRPSTGEPLRVLLSGCIAGWPCGVEGTSYGLENSAPDFLRLSTVETFAFCPEELALGTPRSMPDIHGGDGRDVLDGKARILDEHGVDLTDAMIRGAEAMLAHARKHEIELALLTDMSAACGSQVISRGCRLVEDRKYQVGIGVATALLLRNHYPVVSQRDFKTLALIHAHLDPDFEPEPNMLDHQDHPWVREHLGTPTLKNRS